MSETYLQRYKCSGAVQGSARRRIELAWRSHRGATPAKTKALGLFRVRAAQSSGLALCCVQDCVCIFYEIVGIPSRRVIIRVNGDAAGLKGLHRDINIKRERLTFLQMNRRAQDSFDDRESLVVTR